MCVEAVATRLHPSQPFLFPQLSSKLEAQRGAEAMRQLLSQLDAEWQHLKRLRQKYVGGAAAVAASISPPHAQVGGWVPEWAVLPSVLLNLGASALPGQA